MTLSTPCADDCCVDEACCEDACCTDECCAVPAERESSLFKGWAGAVPPPSPW